MKKLLFIIPSILLVLVLLFVFVINPKISYNKDISELTKKITLVNDYLLNNTGDIKEIKKKLEKEIVSSKRIEIEKETNKYLNSVLENVSDLKTLTRDTKIIDVFNDDKLKDNLDSIIKYQNDSKEKVNDLKEKINSLEKIDDTNIKDNDNKKILNDLFKNNFKLSKYDDEIDKVDKTIDENIERLEYLKKNNKTWNINNNKIVFDKRSNYNEYSKLSNDDNFEIINDKTGPVINASDITITKETKINIKDKVSCNDSVDGKVECKISGDYDTNKVGSYTIKITSTDLSKNTTTKNIKLNVKEKRVTKVNSNKPYYIEVIRNQNVVIVYGKDNNGDYTKIVKVFICSVGKSNTSTPTGTFKTQDKAAWGWLVGNLYGQYYTRIVGSILFHSVPYTKKAKNTLEWDEYNKLGSPASKGCIRMTVRDVKWIYDNCPRGTSVKIYDGKLPSGVSKPTAPKISGTSPNKGWDPTDPDKNNPWKK